jgi:SAM-dependent methyltransferase
VVLLLIGLIAPVSPSLGRLALWMGASLSITALAMVVSSKFGKLKARDSLLDAVSLSPSDTVLDVGCGRGLLLIGAAKRVTKGRAVGIDLWSTTDQFRNSSAATIANAAAEGVGANGSPRRRHAPAPLRKREL